MIYDTLNQNPDGLRNVGVVIGAGLVLAHGWALWQGDAARGWLRRFPFNVVLGRVLLGLAAFWAWALFKGIDWGILSIPRMDMGEYYTLRPKIMFLIPVTAVLVAWFSEEFLSVRALGCLLLLAAAIPLDAAFLHQPVSRLLLVAPAYVAVVAALFWIGMPYLLRDQIDWATANTRRWNLLCGAGLAYWLAVLACAIAW